MSARRSRSPRRGGVVGSLPEIIKGFYSIHGIALDQAARNHGSCKVRCSMPKTPPPMPQAVTLSWLIALFSSRAPHTIVILSAPNRFRRGRTLRAREGPLLPIPGHAQIGNSDMAPIHASACRASQGSFARP
jgi:hypothetical protein